MKKLAELGLSPFPWRTDPSSDIVTPSENLVAIVSDWDTCSREEMTANARIMAAAPELYESLLEICEQFEGGNIHFTGASEWLTRARTVLEKAGGAE